MTYEASFDLWFMLSHILKIYYICTYKILSTSMSQMIAVSQIIQSSIRLNQMLEFVFA